MLLVRTGPQQTHVLIKHMWEAEALNDVPITSYHAAVTEPLTIWDPHSLNDLWEANQPTTVTIPDEVARDASFIRENLPLGPDTYQRVLSGEWAIKDGGMTAATVRLVQWVLDQTEDSA